MHKTGVDTHNQSHRDYIDLTCPGLLHSTAVHENGRDLTCFLWIGQSPVWLSLYRLKIIRGNNRVPILSVGVRESLGLHSPHFQRLLSCIKSDATFAAKNGEQRGQTGAARVRE